MSCTTTQENTKKYSWIMWASVNNDLYLHFVSRLEGMSQLEQRRVAARLSTSVPTLIIYALWYTLASVNCTKIK